MKKNKLMMVDVKDVCSFAEKNFSRDITKDLATEKQTCSIVEAFVAQGGWSSQEGIAHIVVNSEEEAARGLQELLETRANLESAQATFSFKNPLSNEGVVVTPDAVLRAHIEVYGLKIKEPRYNNVSCFFRLSIFNLFNGACQTLNLPLLKQIPIELCEYDNENERVEDCLRENQLKARGKRELTDQDLVTIWTTLFNRGYSQSDFQRTGMTYGGAQKAYAFCLLHKAYPDIDLVNRVLEGIIPLRSLDKERMRKLRTGEATIAEVETYVTNPKKANGNKDKIAPRDKIENLKDHSPVFFIRDICAAIAANDLGRLNSWADVHTEELNEYYDQTFGTVKGAKPAPAAEKLN